MVNETRMMGIAPCDSRSNEGGYHTFAFKFKINWQWRTCGDCRATHIFNKQLNNLTLNDTVKETNGEKWWKGPKFGIYLIVLFWILVQQYNFLGHADAINNLPCVMPWVTDSVTQENDCLIWMALLQEQLMPLSVLPAQLVYTPVQQVKLISKRTISTAP